MIDKEEIEKQIEEMTKLRPDQLSEEGQKLFNTIMTIIDERDYYKARYLEFNNAFIEGGKKLTQEQITGKVIQELGVSDLFKED